MVPRPSTAGSRSEHDSQPRGKELRGGRGSDDVVDPDGQDQVEGQSEARHGTCGCEGISEESITSPRRGTDRRFRRNPIPRLRLRLEDRRGRVFWWTPVASATVLEDEPTTAADRREHLAQNGRVGSWLGTTKPKVVRRPRGWGNPTVYRTGVAVRRWGPHPGQRPPARYAHPERPRPPRSAASWSRLPAQWSRACGLESHAATAAIRARVHRRVGCHACGTEGSIVDTRRGRAAHWPGTDRHLQKDARR